MPDVNCKWRLRAALLKSTGTWVVTKYIKDHTCSIDLRFKAHRGVATARVVVNIVASDYNGEDTYLAPKFINANMNSDHGVFINYQQAWRAKGKAVNILQGLLEDSFKYLPAYLWLLEQANPGTRTSYKVESEDVFKSCFVALGASKSGFRDCIWPIVAIDATFLKGKYREKLFVAIGQDANNQLFTLGFEVAASENDKSWGWFLHELYLVIGPRDDLVIISDRHKAIESNVRRVFPDSLYGICMVHLGRNMNAKFKVKPELFLYNASLAYTIHEFNDVMNRVRARTHEIYRYLLEADPTKWARSHFAGRRYVVMYTNIAESVNTVLKDAKPLPLIRMLEFIHTRMKLWFHDRRRATGSVTSIMTKEVEGTLSRRDDESRHFHVQPVGDHRFIVKDGFVDGRVDLQAMTYSCRVFDLNELSCAHAVKAFHVRNYSIYSLCSRYYTNANTMLAYAVPIMSVPHDAEYLITTDYELSPIGHRLDTVHIIHFVSGQFMSNWICIYFL